MHELHNIEPYKYLRFEISQDGEKLYCYFSKGTEGGEYTCSIDAIEFKKIATNRKWFDVVPVRKHTGDEDDDFDRPNEINFEKWLHDKCEDAHVRHYLWINKYLIDGIQSVKYFQFD